jgi:hypothetical protein
MAKAADDKLTSNAQQATPQAFCCKGQKPTPLRPRDPSWGNNQYKEYEGLILTWSKNPSCPVSIGIDGADYYNDFPERRSLLPRADDTGFAKLVNWMVSLLRYPSSIPDGIKYGRDDIMATNDWEAGGLVSDILLDSYAAQRNLWDFQEA